MKLEESYIVFELTLFNVHCKRQGEWINFRNNALFKNKIARDGSDFVGAWVMK